MSTLRTLWNFLHRIDDVRAPLQAAYNIASLAFSKEGKQQAILGGAVPLLLILLKERAHERVRSCGAAALMAILTDDSGKVALIDAGLEPLVVALEDPSTLVKINVLKAVATAAAHPQAREMLIAAGAVAKLEGLVADGASAVIPSAKSALAAVLWTP